MESVELEYDVYESKDVRSDLPPVVLMHGLFWNKFMYRELARDLALATQRKVFSLDLRNHGESPWCAECDIHVMCKDVQSFMEDMRLSSVAFVCHSFSSTIAYLIALEKPEAVDKIVMVDHPPFVDKGDFMTQVSIQDKLLNRLDPRMTLAEARAKFYMLAEGATKAQGFFLRKAAYDLTKDVGGAFRWKTDIGFLRDKYEQGAFHPEPRGRSWHEILIIRCPNSTRVPDSKFAAVLKHNPNVKLITVEDTTHSLMLEKPKWFVQEVKDFLGSGSHCEGTRKIENTP